MEERVQKVLDEISDAITKASEYTIYRNNEETIQLWCDIIKGYLRPYIEPRCKVRVEEGEDGMVDVYIYYQPLAPDFITLNFTIEPRDEKQRLALEELCNG